MNDAGTCDISTSPEGCPLSADSKAYLADSIRGAFLQHDISLPDENIEQLSQYLLNGIAVLSAGHSEHHEFLRKLDLDDFFFARASKHSKLGASANHFVDQVLNGNAESNDSARAKSTLVSAVGLAPCISMPMIIETVSMESGLNDLPTNTLQWIATCFLQNGIKITALGPIEGLDRYAFLKIYQNTLDPDATAGFKPFRASDLHLWSMDIRTDYPHYVPTNSQSDNEFFNRIQESSLADINKMLDESVEKLAQADCFKTGEWFFNTDRYTMKPLTA